MQIVYGSDIVNWQNDGIETRRKPTKKLSDLFRFVTFSYLVARLYGNSSGKTNWLNGVRSGDGTIGMDESNEKS